MNKIKWIIILASTLLLTGCWDSVEIDDRNVILEVAIDKNQEINPEQSIIDQKPYEVTYTIPDMAKVSGQDSIGENVKSTVTIKSATIAKSVDEAESKLENTVTFSHTKCIVIGGELLQDRQLLKSALDSVLRDMQVGRNTVILATKDKAEDLAKAENEQNPILGLYIMNYYDNGERHVGSAKQQTIGQALKELQETGITTIPLISKGQNDLFRIGGAALIKDYELVEWLSEEEVRGQLLVEGKVRNVPVVVDYKNNYLTYTVEKEKSKIVFKQEGNELRGRIETEVNGSISECVILEDRGMFQEQEIAEITALIEEKIAQQIDNTVNRSKALNTDFLNIGLELYRKEPKAWKVYADTWNDKGYHDFPIDIEVTVRIKNTGTLE